MKQVMAETIQNAIDKAAFVLKMMLPEAYEKEKNEEM